MSYNIVIGGIEYHFDSLQVRISASKLDDGYIQLCCRMFEETYEHLNRPEYLQFKYFPNRIGVVPRYSKPDESEDYVTVSNQSVSISSFQGAKNRTIKPGKYEVEWSNESESYEFVPATIPKPMLRNHSKFVVREGGYSEDELGEVTEVESQSD